MNLFNNKIMQKATQRLAMSVSRIDDYNSATKVINETEEQLRQKECVRNSFSAE